MPNVLKLKKSLSVATFICKKCPYFWPQIKTEIIFPLAEKSNIGVQVLKEVYQYVCVFVCVFVFNLKEVSEFVMEQLLTEYELSFSLSLLFLKVLQNI